MTELVLLSPEEIQKMRYDSFNQADLKAFQSLQAAEYPTYSIAMAHTLYMWENTLFHEARRLSDNYRGAGIWETKNGFFVLQSDDVFTCESGYGEAFELNALEFSIVANLFSLSKVSILSLNKNRDVNRRAVFFSDYIKDVISKNRDILNTRAIYILID
ncbi:hypothetical protein ACT4XN_19515 (plasmid) [Acinetobacter baumannii]